MAYKKKTVNSKKITTLTNDELLEQILNKSKIKKEKKKTTSTVVKTEKQFQTYIRPNKKLVTTDSEELYEKIIAKKKARVAKKATKVVVEKEKIPVDTSSVSAEEVAPTLETPVEDVHKEPEKDLIITKEITVDVNKLDIKDEQVINKIREAVLEEQAKDDSFVDKSEEEIVPVEEVVEEEPVEKVEEPLVFPKKKSFNQLSYIIPAIIIVVVVGILVIFASFKDGNRNLASTVVGDFGEVHEITEDDNSEELAKAYEDCLDRPYSVADETEVLQGAKVQLDSYLARYKTSVGYEELKTGYTYSYNPDKVYYGASVLKLLAATYIYSKASLGEIDLNTTMTYTSKYSWSESLEMKKHKFGDNITLRDLVRYAVTVSDNSAYQMLVSYIGRQNLKNFGLDLGAKYTLNGGDNFGSLTTGDAIIYLETLNNCINNNVELGGELKQVFLSALQNDLALPDYGIEAAHKYGEYKPNYHDIGIVYDENPYLVAVLTTEGYGDYEGKVKDISSHVYKFHSIFWENRKGICFEEIYQ